eukprot:TRINITY_DN24088_c0_g1_i1.p1 TRINITY_DN24088_c0_g1~~TRINITY_DN24088_c0_g1_i1.p1  ORF type:complete len:242 (+),score=36.35 TRINITY_DN24088_c0_g1_i1:80-805(+)
MTDAACLIFELHGKLLRAVAAAANQHFEGLGQASRCKALKLSSRQRRKLTQIDAAFQIVRHITKVSSVKCLKEFEEHFTTLCLEPTGSVTPDAGVSSQAREHDVFPSSRRGTFSDKPDIVEYATEAHVRQEDTPTCVSLPQAAWSCLFARSQHADIITEFQNVLDQSFAPRIRIDVERDARYGIFEHTFDIIFNEIHDTVSPGLCHMPPELRGILDQFLRRHVLILTCSLLLRGVCAEAEQ